jgi:hypothetical protein
LSDLAQDAFNRLGRWPGDNFVHNRGADDDGVRIYCNGASRFWLTHAETHGDGEVRGALQPFHR